ncbi:MAG: ATP-binding protein, partial [Planctomycetota bacterium]
MVGWIIERSTESERSITPGELFEAFGLNQTASIADLVQIQLRSARAIHDQLGRLSYRQEWDVRSDLEYQDKDEPITVITGPSGSGKSWALYAHAASPLTPATVLIPSGRDARETIVAACERFWQEYLGHDSAKPLSNVASHLRDILGSALPNPWLTVLVDRVSDLAVADELSRLPVEDWGVKLVVACDPHVASVIGRGGRSENLRVRKLTLGTFTTPQVHDYLKRRLGESFAVVPDDLR